MFFFVKRYLRHIKNFKSCIDIGLNRAAAKARVVGSTANLIGTKGGFFFVEKMQKQSKEII